MEELHVGFYINIALNGFDFFNPPGSGRRKEH
jgi:hypothetical protein